MVYKPNISIIIPVFNVENYLRECLDSVRAQTFNDWECICVDDGSTDSSSAILDEYAANDSRFRIIHREHSNAGACRNAGLDVASGKFLSFLDSDDVFAPRMLEIHVKAIEKYNADVSICGMVKYRDGEKMPLLVNAIAEDSEAYYENPARNIDIYGKWNGRAWDKLFNAKFVMRHSIRFQEIRSTNDMRFTYMALSLANKVVFLNSALIAHRLNPTSLEATRSKGALCMIDALKSYHHEMQLKGIFEECPKLLYNYKRWIVEIMFWYMDTIDTVDSYEIVHKAFHDICEYFELCELVETDFVQCKELYRRFDGIRHGCSPMESLRYHEQLLMAEVQKLEHLRRLKGIDKTKDYKLGHFLLALPRFFKRFFKSIL